MTRLGVAITTKDRPEVMYESLRAHWDCLPVQTHVGRFVIVDDGSAEPFTTWLQREHPDDVFGGIEFVRHEQPWGIARSKNHGLALLMEDGCTDLFLWDDDARPLRHDWYLPYVAHPEGHLQFNYPGGNAHDAPLTQLYQDMNTTAYHASRGVVLYYTAAVIAAVGGMDPQYRFGFEHQEHSARIHAAGYSTWAAQSPRHGFFGDAPMIAALDETQAVESVITARQRREHATPNLVLLAAHQGRTTFIPYVEPTNTVLTCLFTGIEDPGDPNHPREPWAATTSPATILLDTLGHRRFTGPQPWAVPVTVLHNEELDRGPGADGHAWVNWVRVPIDEGLNVYVQRWVSIRQYLIAHPTIEKLWVVDCSDVEYLQRPRDPFAEIDAGRLYVGVEDRVAGIDWMITHHPASRAWLNAHPRAPLFNAGVLGGDRNAVLQFIQNLLNAYRRAVVSNVKGEVGDMGFVQQGIAAMTVPVVFGPQVTSVFKGYQSGNVSALWRHK